MSESQSFSARRKRSKKHKHVFPTLPCHPFLSPSVSDKWSIRRRMLLSPGELIFSFCYSPHFWFLFSILSRSRWEGGFIVSIERAQLRMSVSRIWNFPGEGGVLARCYFFLLLERKTNPVPEAVLACLWPLFLHRAICPHGMNDSSSSRLGSSVPPLMPHFS